ncbi:MAG: hypothetical protein JST59_00045 [Actinobacteria bacterium]|nr:hypothetical protein [Actinomycetota bacterium]
MTYGQKLVEADSRINAISKDLDNKVKEIRVLHERLGETDVMNKTIHGLNDRVARLAGENEGLVNDVREGQEKLRLSTSQMSNLANQLNDFKFKVQQFTSENENLRKKLQEAGDANMKISELERRARDLEFRNQSLEREKGESDGRVRNSEQKIIALTTEIERVNNLYGNAGKESEANKRKLMEYEQK